MDLIIKHGEQTKGRLKEELFPVFQYFCREIGYEVSRDISSEQIYLTHVLSSKRVIISSMEKTTVSSFRKKNLEKLLIEKIQDSLEAAGVFGESFKQSEEEEETVQLKIALLEVPHIKEPRLKLTLCKNAKSNKLIEYVRSECNKAGIRMQSNFENKLHNPSFIQIQVMSPACPEEQFWDLYGGNYVSIITVGLLAKLLEDFPLAVLSFAPISKLLELFGANTLVNNTHSPNQKKMNQVVSKAEILNREKIKKAEVFLDYHLLMDKSTKKAQVMGGLYIKNVGTEILRNPIICIKTKPEQNVKITGQILPKNYVETKGVLNQEGIRGWQYMKDNWLEDFEQKGELWICPIHTLEIKPGKTESLSNLQISLLEVDEETLLVEAYVYFSEDRLEFTSNNRISLSIQSTGEKNIKNNP